MVAWNVHSKVSGAGGLRMETGQELKVVVEELCWVAGGEEGETQRMEERVKLAGKCSTGEGKIRGCVVWW